jgi:hypothetical protein
MFHITTIFTGISNTHESKINFYPAAAYDDDKCGVT